MSFPLFPGCRIQVETSHAVGFIAFARQLFQRIFIRNEVYHFCESGGKICKACSQTNQYIRAGLLLRFCGQAISTGAPPRGPSPAKYAEQSFLPDAPTGLHPAGKPAFHLHRPMSTRLPLRQRSAAISHTSCSTALKPSTVVSLSRRVERCVFHIWASCGGFKYCCIPHPER
ncbi:Uncharacterised protein [Escherichia coli]|nr:Uncharacterised protein [Escherichia coli]